MSIGLRLDLRQSQQLVMTPQLQQAIKLLQMSNLEIVDFVEHELERNPLLDRESAGDADLSSAPQPERPALEAADTRMGEADPGLAREVFDTGAENLQDAAPGDGPPALSPSDGWASVGKGAPEDWTDLSERLRDRPTLREHLLSQLGQTEAPELVAMLAGYLVEELDEHGYLREDLDELAVRLGAARDDMRAALTLLQGCEPTGVGARDLAECLALQLAERDRLDPAMRKLLDNLALLERGEVDRLRQAAGVDAEDFAAMLAELRALDPRPCAAFGTEEPETLIPDILVTRTSFGGWQVDLNSDTLPRLIMNNTYGASIAAMGDEARSFMTECRTNASWLIKSLDQRARTIVRVGAEIVRRQEEFFRIGIAGLRPLTLRDIAETLGLHESTISRVTSNKYMATDRGIFELKFFFTNAVGTESHAAEAIRHRIRQMVDSENPRKILSDDAIVERLRADGIDIARRTVAKYRKLQNIPSSAARRRQKALAGGAGLTPAAGP